MMIGLTATAFGQPGTVHFQNLAIKDGLVDDHILCMYQDTKGFLWLGTYAGLHRYDGYTFKVYNSDGQEDSTANKLANNTVYTILEDSQQKLWIGTENGLSHYDPELDSFTNYYPQAEEPWRGPSHGNIRCLYEDEQGQIWLGTYGGGLNRFDPATRRFEHYLGSGQLRYMPSPRINDFYVDKHEQFWIGTEEDGLVLFDKSQETFRYFRPDSDNPDALSNATVNHIVEDKNGKLWVGTWGGGVCQFDPQTERFKTYAARPGDPQALQNGIVRYLLEDSHGRLWVATFGGGLSVYDPQADGFVTYSARVQDPSSLSNNLLWTLFEDQTGLLWVGTHGSGLDRVRPGKEGFRHVEVPGSSLISTFCEMRDGTVWIGTIDGGIAIMDGDRAQVRPFGKFPEQPLTTIRTLFEDAAGRVWIGTDAGLYQYQPKTGEIKAYLHRPDDPQSIGKHGVYSMAQDRDGNLWVGTWDTGLNKLTPTEAAKADPREAVFVHYAHQPEKPGSLSSNKIWTIYVDQNNNLWCGTEKSLDRFSPATGSFTSHGQMNAGRIIEDQAGLLWIGTYGNGLARFNPKTNQIRYYNQLRTLDINLILDLVADEDENLWLASIDGITKFNTRTEKFVNLDLSNELKQNELQINVLERLSTGECLVGGDFGVDLFAPDQLKIRETVPRIELTDIKLFNRSIFPREGEGARFISKTTPYAQEISLSHRENLLSIDFALLYYTSQEKHVYAYKLDGVDEEWNYTHADNRRATYMNLSPGEYTFRVKGATRDGNWSEERRLLLRVAAPFWATLAFKLSVGGLAVLGLVLGYRLMVQAERKRVYWQMNTDKLRQEQELIRLQKEKLDAELEDKKKELASSALQSLHQTEQLSHVHSELKTLLPKLKGSTQERKVKRLIESIHQYTNDAESWEFFEKNFNLHEDFLKRFVERYPKLTSKDLKICAFIRMNFDNKDIAHMLNITPESLGVSRTRIRKKINLDRGIYLNDFIMRF